MALHEVGRTIASGLEICVYKPRCLPRTPRTPSIAAYVSIYSDECLINTLNDPITGCSMCKDLQSQVDSLPLCPRWRDGTPERSQDNQLQGGAVPSCQSCKLLLRLLLLLGRLASCTVFLSVEHLSSSAATSRISCHLRRVFCALAEEDLSPGRCMQLRSQCVRALAAPIQVCVWFSGSSHSSLGSEYNLLTCQAHRRYKTRLCSFGSNCNRPICFFAHSAEELRCVPNVDDGKELDEREYLLQLMLAQDSGLMSPASLHNLGQPMAPLQSNIDMVPLPPGRSSSLPQLSMQSVPMLGMNQHHLPKPHRGVGVGGPIPTSQAGGHDPMLMNLQEAMAGVSLNIDGMSAVSGAPHPGRISDPGTGLLGASNLIGAVNPIPHMNRISDSGQTMGVVSSKGLTASALAASLESLIPLMNSLGNTGMPKPPVSSPPLPRSPPHSSLSTSPAPESPLQQQAQPMASSHNQHRPGSIQQQQQHALNALAAAAAAAAANPGMGTAPLNQLVSQLQDQGLAGE